LLHPRDGRSVFIFPWESLTIVGTTDVDTHGDLAKEPRISLQEAEYLFELVNFTFPTVKLTKDDVISTWAGIRPVIDTGKTDPSKESREHVIWEENGLLTITGGKLTTFRIMAQQAIRQALKYIGTGNPTTRYSPILDPTTLADIPSRNYLTPSQIVRLVGRYGQEASHILANSSREDFDIIGGTDYLWAEISWAIKNEAVVHLDDLLLRRARIGLQVQGGGASILPRIKPIFQQERGWDDLRWETEKQNYLLLREEAYGL
jgi:glycerol-3-phosphate dehydrogenase